MIAAVALTIALAASPPEPGEAGHPEAEAPARRSPSESGLVGRVVEPNGGPLAVYLRSGVSLYLSDAQTVGGIGGGVGMRYTHNDWLFAQLDASRLAMIGNPTLVRIGAGVQRRGTWAPAATLSGSAFVGDRLRFLTDAHPAGVRAPALALGVNVAPLRWVSRTSEVTLLELGAGVGWDFPGRGLAINLGLLEIAHRF